MEDRDLAGPAPVAGEDHMHDMDLDQEPPVQLVNQIVEAAVNHFRDPAKEPKTAISMFERDNKPESR